MPTLAEHGHPVSEQHGLVDVVRDEQHRGPQLPVQAPELLLQPAPAHGVDGAERLVHEQHARLAGQRAGHPDALALAAGQLVGVAPGVGGRRKAHEVEQLRHTGARAFLFPAEQGRDGLDVLGDGPVREQPHVLDHVADAAAQKHGVHAGDVHAVEQDAPRGGLDQPVDHAHGGRLAAARGSHEHEEFVLVDVEVEVGDGAGAVRVGLAGALEADEHVGASGRGGGIGRRPASRRRHAPNLPARLDVGPRG